jgi:DNA primase
MHVAQILERLDAVRIAGDDKWIARCPAHDDRTPSLSVALAGNGRILMHCHAGCAITAVLAAHAGRDGGRR